MPTFSSQPGSATGQDSFLDSANPTTNNNGEVEMYYGESGGQTTRSTLKFVEVSTVPSGSVPGLGTLSLYTQTAAAANGTVVLYSIRPARDWVASQETWNIYKTANNWGTAGCSDINNDRFNVIVGSTTVSTGDAAGTEKQIVIPAGTLSDWINNPSGNQGFLIKATVESANQGSFRTCKNATALTRPKLVFDYSIPTSGLLMNGLM